MQSERHLGFIQCHVGRRVLRIDLAQRRHVIEHPKGASVCCRDEVVVFYDQIVNRGLRQIQLQRLPMRTIIGRNVNAKLSPGVEQAFALRILAHAMDVGAVRNSGRNRIPRFSEVSRSEDVGLKIIEPMTIDCDVGSIGVMRRRINNADGAPFRHLRGHFRPMLAIVRGNLNQAVVGTGPDCSLLLRRLGQRENGVKVFHAGDVVGQWAAARLLLRFIVSSEIRTDLVPGHPVIG